MTFGRAAAWSSVLLLAAATAGLAAPRGEAPDDAARLMDDLMSGRGPVGGPFALTDTQGRRRSLAEFRGRIVLLYFGYTACPDACPADLAQIARAVSTLDDGTEPIQPIFITLDPERDTARILRDYASAFHPRLLALRGTPAQIRAVARAYKVAFRRVPSSGSQAYVLDHTAFTYVLDREGKYVAFLPPGTPAERMTAMVRKLLQE